jgi:hypothetical protein
MSAYPLIVFVVSLAFCLAVARQYLQRRRPYQLIWTISLAAAAIGSLAYLIFLNDGKSELAFRIYYIGGALLTAPLLGLGSILLIARSETAQRRAWWVVAVVGTLCAIGAVLLLVSPVDTKLLHALNGGSGSDPSVYKQGIGVAFIAVLNSFGALAVIGVALYSGWQLQQRHVSSRLVWANVLIAGGTIIISLAGTVARIGVNDGLFWITMAVGWVVLFGGFLLTATLQRPASATAQGTSAIAGSRA